MSMIVARMQKMKAGNLIGIGNHNQRKTENHSNKDIDPSLSDLNYDLVNHTENYKKDIENFINENKSSIRAVRKDAVLINEWIITSDKKFFENLSNEETRDFFQAAKDHFAENFGEENIRYAIVHLDESTPHMHMGIVPFDKDKKLSAKRVFNREALRNVQEDLPKHLQEQGFDIERGIEGSERKNLTVPEFKEMKNEQKEIERTIEIKKNELLAYTKELKIDNELDFQVLKEKKEVEVETDEKNLFGKPKMKKVEKYTGSLIISEKDFLGMREKINNGKKSQERLNNILKTDFYKENEGLEKKVQELSKENYRLIEEKNKVTKLNNKQISMYYDLEEDNKLLNTQISELKQEISFIYRITKEFFKERTDDLEAFKSIFKDWADNVSTNLQNNNLIGYFKKEYDKDNRIKTNKKPGFDLEDLKRRADEINKSNKKEKSIKKDRDFVR